LPDPVTAAGVPRPLPEGSQRLRSAAREVAGIKQKLSSAIVIIAGIVGTGYDFLAPIVSGVDMSSFATYVPSRL
jgi:hypothetical protein